MNLWIFRIIDIVNPQAVNMTFAIKQKMSQ